MKNEKNFIFDTLFEGKIAPDKIIIKKVPGLLKRNGKSEKFIENEWQKNPDSGLKTWPTDAQPGRYHFGGLKISKDSVEIFADPTISYRDVIGSRPVEFRKLFKKEYWPTPITVDMVVAAKNRKGEKMLAVTLRNPTHDSTAGGFHVTTGGAMEIFKDKKPIDAALRETEEECGIKPEELSNTLCRSIVFNPSLSEIGIIFVSTANIPVEEIQSRPHDEENKTLFIPAEKNNLEYWLLELTHANSVDGIAGILIAGEDLYGRKWAENILAKILKKSRGYKNSQKRKELEKIDIEKLRKLISGLEFNQ